MAFIRRSVPFFVNVIGNVAVQSQVRTIKRWVAPTLMELKNREKKYGGKKTNPRNTYLEWNLEAELYGFSKRLNEDFNSDLLLQAFTDRSYVIKEELKQKEMEFEVKMKDNRELTKDGEKFLNQYIKLYLETVLPRFPMDGINAVLLHLTSDATLAHISKHLGTKDIILAAEYPVDELILANTFKALVSALMLSSGEERAAHFVRDFVITQLQGQDVNEYWHIEDPWTMLTDYIGKSGKTIEPRLIGEVGKNTLLACYRVGLYVDKNMLSSGFGESVAIAKEMAARDALKKIFGTEDHMRPIDFQLKGIPSQKMKVQHQVSAS